MPTDLKNVQKELYFPVYGVNKTVLKELQMPVQKETLSIFLSFGRLATAKQVSDFVCLTN